MTDRVDSQINLSLPGGKFVVIRACNGVPAFFDPPGSLCIRADGGVSTSLYVKETVVTSNVWQAK
jgi:hypothetical protein